MVPPNPNFPFPENWIVKNSAPTKKTAAPHERAFHALFPAPLDADPADLAGRDISWLYVWRDKEALHEGPLPREALTDPSDLVRQWGGGVYEVRAKDADKKFWTANATYTFSGPRKAFNTPDPGQAAPAPAARGAMPDLPGILPVVTGLVGAFTPLVTAILDRSDRREEQRRRDEEKREDERRRSEEKRDDERRRAEEKREERDRQFMQQQAQMQQNTLQMMVGLSQSQTGTAQTLAALEKGLQIGQQVGANSDDDDVLESLGQLMGGWQQAKNPGPSN